MLFQPFICFLEVAACELDFGEMGLVFWIFVGRGKGRGVYKHGLLERKGKKIEQTHKSPRRTQRTRMHTLQHTMHGPIHPGHALPRRVSPRQKHHAAHAHFGHGIDDFLGEFLPAVVGVAVGFGRLDCQAGVEHQHAAVRPGGEQASVLGGRAEGGVVVFQRDVHVF